MPEETMSEDTKIDFSNWTCPLPLQDYPTIVMGHGGGGKLSSELVEHLFLPAFRNETLAGLGDAAVIQPPAGRLALSTDTFVVQPLFFPGGTIGDLAVNGTVNDLAVSGARPLYLTAGFVLEEGFPITDLARIVQRMGASARAAGVQIVTGDTKVVERGHGDGCYINTAGVGVIPDHVNIGPSLVRPEDVILVSGTIADHGMAIMSVREGLEFDSAILSDCAPLNELAALVLEAGSQHVHAMRDPTRGGLGATLHEIAGAAKVGIVVEETQLPVRPAVHAACELLGLDPMFVANEGKLAAFVAPEAADAVLAAMRSHKLGAEAQIIGRVVAEHPRMLVAHTRIGSNRVIPEQIGEQLPRIC